MIVRNLDVRHIDHRRVLKTTARVAHVSYLSATAFDIVSLHAVTAGFVLVLVLVDFVIHYE